MPVKITFSDGLVNSPLIAAVITKDAPAVPVASGAKTAFKVALAPEASVVAESVNPG